MQAFRSAILYFKPHGQPGESAIFETDGLLVVGPNARGTQVVLDVGSWSSRAAQFPEVPVQDLRGRLIAPGFVDLHSHYPQCNVIGSPADGLLPWLENYTFPEEKRFSAQDYCAQAATFFIEELLRNGITTSLTFATSHPQSVHAMFEAAQASHLRLITGLCLMDRHAPADLLNQPLGHVDATEQSLIDSEALIRQWHGVDRLGYAITPRFAPTCSESQLRGAGELAARYPGGLDSVPCRRKQGLEIAWARGCFPPRAVTWPPTPTLA